MTDEQIEEIRSDTYELIQEEFIDQIFDAESKLARKEWESLVVKKAPWIFNP